MYEDLPILICIADDTKWLFFRIVPPPSAGEQYTTKLGYISFERCCVKKTQPFKGTKIKTLPREHGSVFCIVPF